MDSWRYWAEAYLVLAWSHVRENFEELPKWEPRHRYIYGDLRRVTSWHIDEWKGILRNETSMEDRNKCIAESITEDSRQIKLARLQDAGWASESVERIYGVFAVTCTAMASQGIAGNTPHDSCFLPECPPKMMKAQIGELLWNSLIELGGWEKAVESQTTPEWIRIRGHRNFASSANREIVGVPAPSRGWGVGNVIHRSDRDISDSGSASQASSEVWTSTRFLLNSTDLADSSSSNSTSLESRDSPSHALVPTYSSNFDDFGNVSDFNNSSVANRLNESVDSIDSLDTLHDSVDSIDTTDSTLTTHSGDFY
eukprot:Blabericola_migrator_1__2158@NODE_1596_length_4206_cov_133_794395_g1044_i0_p2_GENE_NODE_1596_length_4206_cov_133_794395_g1044_i0NODE_1596_length_4206_cov_133_794395_g1044_i0_p2_ORF_typecomplete_len311_score39_73_NODE_1596_length_4206_cov_133_794395_g1044_i010521984